MSVFEQTRVMAWLDSTLTTIATANGATGGAWEGMAPIDVDINAIVIIYTVMASADVTGVAANRLWTNNLYLIKVTGPASSLATMSAVMDAIDSTLQLIGLFNIGPASDVHLMRCVREGAVPLPSQVIDGDKYQSLGAMWRIFAQ